MIALNLVKANRTSWDTLVKAKKALASRRAVVSGAVDYFLGK